MENLQAIFDKIMENEQLKEALTKAMKSDKLLDFFKEQGSNASLEDIKELIEKNKDKLSEEAIKSFAKGALENIDMPDGLKTAAKLFFK